MTSQPGKQTIATHILTNISRSRDNQAMKFGQLMEYNMRKVFREKSYKTALEILLPDPFIQLVFIVCQVED